MSKPTLQGIHVTLEKHIAVADERFIEMLNRVKRLERIMVGTAGTSIVLLIGLLVR